MTRSGASHIYHTAKAKAGITKGGGIHTLRHCFATELLEAGTELPVLQRLMGHSSIRALSRLALSGQLFKGAKRWAPVPPPPRPSAIR